MVKERGQARERQLVGEREISRTKEKRDAYARVWVCVCALVCDVSASECERERGVRRCVLDNARARSRGTGAAHDKEEEDVGLVEVLVDCLGCATFTRVTSFALAFTRRGFRLGGSSTIALDGLLQRQFEFSFVFCFRDVFGGSSLMLFHPCP